VGIADVEGEGVSVEARDKMEEVDALAELVIREDAVGVEIEEE
jgi:hypothetical protein